MSLSLAPFRGVLGVRAAFLCPLLYLRGSFFAPGVASAFACVFLLGGPG